MSILFPIYRSANNIYPGIIKLFHAGGSVHNSHIRAYLSKILCGQDNDFFVQTVTTRHTAFLCYYLTDAKEVVTLETPSNKKDAAAVLFESLGLAKHKVISITGGGGKTSLMSALGRHSSRDAFTLITTTTKIFPPQDGSPAATIAEAKDLINALSAIGPSASMVTAAKEKVGEKLCGYSPEEIAEIASGSPHRQDHSRSRRFKRPFLEGVSGMGASCPGRCGLPLHRCRGGHFHITALTCQHIPL